MRHWHPTLLLLVLLSRARPLLPPCSAAQTLIPTACDTPYPLRLHAPSARPSRACPGSPPRAYRPLREVLRETHGTAWRAFESHQRQRGGQARVGWPSHRSDAAPAGLWSGGDARATQTATRGGVPLAREFRDVCADAFPRRCNVDMCGVSYGALDEYEVSYSLGRGRYSSDVLLARRVPLGGSTTRASVDLAAKLVHPTNPDKIQREACILRDLQSCPHVAKLVDVVHDHGDGSHAKALLFEYAGTPLKPIGQHMNESETRRILYHILTAIHCAHSRGIMHRDIKPGNVVIDATRRYATLLDWGLSEYYFPGTRYGVSVGTRQYKAPELLLGMTVYHYAVDMWAFGCVMAAVVGRRPVVFPGDTNEDITRSVAQRMGSRVLRDIALRHGLLNEETAAAIGNFSSVAWPQSVVGTDVPHDARHLLTNALDVDFTTRITATEALRHPYFADIWASDELRFS